MSGFVKHAIVAILLLLFITVGRVPVSASGKTGVAEPPEKTRVSESPEAVQPLAVGDSIPDVTLVTPAGRPVELRDVLSKQATVLIFYRGGW